MFLILFFDQMLGAKDFCGRGFCIVFLISSQSFCELCHCAVEALDFNLHNSDPIGPAEFRVYILALQTHVDCEISQSSNAFSHCGSFAHCSTSIGLCIWSGVLVTVVPEFWIGMAPLGCLQSQVLLSCCRPQVSHFWCNMAWKTCFYFVCKFNKLKLVIWWSK